MNYEALFWAHLKMFIIELNLDPSAMKEFQRVCNAHDINRHALWLV